MALAVCNCSVARRFKDFSTAMFFLLAGVVAQLKCALFRIIVYYSVTYAHAPYVMGKRALYVGLMLLTIVYACINFIYKNRRNGFQMNSYNVPDIAIIIFD